MTLSEIAYWVLVFIVGAVLLYILYTAVAQYQQLLDALIRNSNPIVVYVDTSVPGHTIINVGRAK